MTDRARVTELLGRPPRGEFEVVVRAPQGDPVVIRNAPLLDDGTPMPTRFWLVDPEEIRRIGQLESAGGVDRAEAEVDAGELAAAHDRYAAERDAAIPDDHVGHRPSGGVGGTRVGVKCLHAHRAWHLAGGDDPVGRWIERELIAPATSHFEIGADHIELTAVDGTSMTLPWGHVNLAQRWLSDHDPPFPEDLTNALGTIDDEMDDVLRDHPAVTTAPISFGGTAAGALADLEAGHRVAAPTVTLTRADADAVFRIVARLPRGDRADEPGLPEGHADTIVATLCVVLAVMRRLRIDRVELSVPRER